MSFLKGVKKKYNTVNKSINQVTIIIIIICFGYLILNSINKNNITNTNIASDNQIFSCELSSINEGILETGDLKTNTFLSLIDITAEIFKTSLKKNQIPYLINPILETLGSVSECTTDNDLMVVVTDNNITQIYPKSILNYHISINDTINNKPILVSYSPLSNHFEVFERSFKDKVLEFGVSGSLYKNVDLLYDTETETLWSQFNGKALVGNYSGAILEKLPFKLLTFNEIKIQYPQARIVSFKTGYKRNYNFDPFIDYRNSEEIVAFITNNNSSFSKRDLVAGFIYNKMSYVIEEKLIFTKGFFQIGFEKFSIEEINGEIKIFNLTNNVRINNLTKIYAFVWFDFFPQTEILVPSNSISNL